MDRGGANGITQVAPTYFWDSFGGVVFIKKKI
jgi:hypothetical protein